MAPDEIAEAALIDVSRWLREATDKEIRRWHVLLDAGLSAAEANRIASETTEPATRKEAA